MGLERTFFGNYKPERVEDYVEDNQNKLRQVERKLKDNEARLLEYEEREKAISDALIEAKYMAQFIIKKAETEAQKIENDAAAEARLTMETLEKEMMEKRREVQSQIESDQQKANEKLHAVRLQIQSEQLQARQEIQQLKDQKNELLEQSNLLKERIQRELNQMLHYVGNEITQTDDHYSVVDEDVAVSAIDRMDDTYTETSETLETVVRNETEADTQVRQRTQVILPDDNDTEVSEDIPVMKLSDFDY